MKNIKTEIFLGKAINPSDGQWYSLPMEQDQLKELLFSKEAYIISDYICDLKIYLDEYDKEKVLELNEVLNSNNKELLTIYMWTDSDLDTAKKVFDEMDRDCYIFFDNIEDGPQDYILEQLGENLVEKGFIGEIPQELIDKDYLNFEKIGRDYWLGSNVHYEPITESIFIQYKSR